ncbi:hypothetical protein LSUCC0031_02225 [Rhodobacterales bacterium LSUCC0031]|nr:hypothetical protein [Rhodobacterales bacterium LSUCC0031]
MTEIAREHFYQRLESAPYAVLGFFETIIRHFERKNDVLVHHTDTNGGDLRLAIPAEVLGQNRLRNFATLYWQSTKQEVFSRTSLTPDELNSFGFDMGEVPKAASEPLKSDIRLAEAQWRYGVADFTKALEAAKIKTINQLVSTR